MADTMRLRVVLDMAERVLAPLKRIQSGSNEAANALKATRDRLKELNAQQAAVGHVQKQQAEFARLNNELKVKQSLLAGLRAGGVATAAQLKREESGVRRLSDALELQRAAAGKARAALNAMGVTGSLSAAQSRLKSDIDNATGAMTRQRAELQRLAQHQQRLQALNEKHAKAMMHTGVAAGAGMAMQAAGRRGVEIGMGPVRNYSQHEDAMLGIARQVPGARNEMGQLTEVYRQAERDVRTLSGQIPLATTEITNMMTAAARMEVPTDQLKEFTLMASEMATAFDAVPDEITESMGKVAKNFKIPLTDIRGLADAINYLDDNAISKGADIINFLNRTSGVVSTVAMSPQDAAALGSTLLTLGERTETAGTAANAIVQKFAAATKGTKKFKSAMEEIGLSTEAVQKGMSTDATGTLNQVIEAIGKLPESQRIGVMVELVGMEHSDTLAKLVDKPEELARQRALANGSEAKGSMAREAAARNATLSAQWQMTKNRAFNLSAVVGQSLLPSMLSLMAVVNPLIEGFARWVQENPVLVGWVMKLAIGAAALLTVLGAVLLPLALIAGKAMLIRFLFARLALSLGGMRAAAAAAGPAMGMLYRLGFLAGRAFALLRGGAALLLGGLRALAVFLIANPIVAVFALLATAAYMVWRNWDGIKGGLLAIWQQLSGAVSAWWASTAAGAAALWQDLVGLKDRFFSAGADLMSGLMNGITSRLAAVREAVVGAADAVGAWFREKLGIASPSKVFMQYGGWISEGAALGIAGGQGAVRNAALGMATAATLAMPMAANGAALRLDTRPPLGASAAAAPGSGGGSTYTITINPAPGMDPQAIARAVSAELDRRERSKQSRRLSALHDID
ncbi:phage tail tape measure protein [Rhodococcus sp. SRB_17]|uniref:phage tail tape measure protein n=1 Tax=Acidovorax sp. SRB_24 TaxID=1962700 RepID=UPI00145C49C7|nr:phage tail tape measure protein [Acidovorax sp. SRB_24]NMM75549.1 phage tail tape measure protein [Acidovorax sp. SRB_24]NMM85069.1 phage tail tape measure protein [Rhodococcus sp. SRB_17]